MTNPKDDLGKGFVRQVTRENFDTLRHLLRAPGAPTGAVAVGGIAMKVEAPEVTAARALFKGHGVKVPNWFSPAVGTASGSGPIPTQGPMGAPAPQSAHAPVALPSQPVWSKTLSKTDAQRQSGNKTGDLRLIKADQPIDQKTFFRFAVFGKLAWTTEPRGHEEATGTFDVTILGTHHGVLPLTLSHRPLGHADQENYTTGLRWGSLAGLLRSQIDVTKKQLRLYSLPNTAPADFAIEIV